MSWQMADAAEPAARRVMKFALVLLLHAAVLGWLLEHQIRTSHEPAIVRMDVRMIDVPPPVVDKPRPSPERQRTPVPQAVTAPPPPVLTAAPSADPVPAAFAVAPPPPAPAREIPAAVPIVPATPTPPVPVTAARFNADYLKNPAPGYPVMSRRLGEEGRVLLLVRVTPQGLPESVVVNQSSGFSRLDEAALAAVRQWRFVPARSGTEAIADSVTVPIIFRRDG
jgi:protein TonB